MLPDESGQTKTPAPAGQQPAEPAPVTPAQQTNMPDAAPVARPVSIEPVGVLPPSPPSPPARSALLRWTAVVLAVLLVLAGIGALWWYKSSQNEASARFKVGVLVALTGGSSSMGYGNNKGIQLAQKQLAASNIEVIQADSKCDPKVAAEAIKRLIEQQVIAIIGDGCSSASTAVLPAANNSKIPLISPTASSPSLSIPNDYFFRVIPNDTFQGAFMAQAIFEQGHRKVAVFYTDEPYGNSMSKVFKEKFESLGGSVLASVPAESDVINLQNQIGELKAAKAEAVFFAPNSVVSATAAIKLAREAGITVPFYGADIFYDTTILKDAGPAAANSLVISTFPTGSRSFKQALLNEYQVAEQLYGAAQAYDAFHAIHMAIQRGARTGEQVKQLLPQISFMGVSAKISFDENGEISDKNYKYDLLKVKDGEFVAAATEE